MMRRARGFIRFPAFSFHGDKDDFPRIVDAYDDWAFAQIQYNYVDTEFQAGFSGLRYAADKGMGVVVMEPLKGGHLANAAPPSLQAVFASRPESWSAAEWALRYVWNDAGVSLLLSGMNNAAQLSENLRVAHAAKAGTLTAEQLSVFAVACAALRTHIKVDCTNCRYCQPCSQGVEIPEILAAYNAAAMWNTRESWTTGYAVIKGKPDKCTECGDCEKLCPQAFPFAGC